MLLPVRPPRPLAAPLPVTRRTAAVPPRATPRAAPRPRVAGGVLPVAGVVAEASGEEVATVAGTPLPRMESAAGLAVPTGVDTGAAAA
jgi:hypothetical protein